MDFSVPSDPSVRFWIFNTSVVFWILDFGFWILDFGHYGSIFIDQNLDVNVRFMALLIVETSL